MEPTKIIFCGIGGVISLLRSEGWQLVPERMELVEQIVKATDAKIVIHSSQRENNLEKNS